MAIPQFSVVIPTRNRQATLNSSISTVLRQSFADFELVVMDNASTPSAAETIGHSTDPRLRVIRRETPASMTENWNEALANTRGQWIIFIGDDDGLVPGALDQIAQAANDYDVRSIRWDWASYTWPEVEPSEWANLLAVPFAKHPQLIEYSQRISEMLATGTGSIVPHTYHSAMRRDLIEEVMQSGPFFEGPCPDLLSGVLCSQFADQFLELNWPATVSGFSARSNTIAHRSADPASETKAEFTALNQQAALRVHPDLPDALELGPVAYWDALFRMRDRFNLARTQFSVSPDVVVQQSLNSIVLSGEIRRRQIRSVLDWWERNGEGSTFEPVVPDENGGVDFAAPVEEPAIYLARVVARGSSYDCATIQDACDLAGSILEVNPTLVELSRRAVLDKDADTTEIARLHESFDHMRDLRDGLAGRLAARERELKSARKELDKTRQSLSTLRARTLRGRLGAVKRKVARSTSKG